MCTGIFLRTQENEYVFSRTLEFGMPFNWYQICNNNLIGTVGNFTKYGNRLSYRWSK